MPLTSALSRLAPMFCSRVSLRTATPLEYVFASRKFSRMAGKPPVLPVVKKKDIPRLFKLEPTGGPGIYRADYHGDPSPFGQNIYGGLLFAQALEAAQLDVDPAFLPTSLHSLFVSYPFSKFPVDYKVEWLRDGNSFCARAIKGIQKDQVVFAGIANFSKPSDRSIYHSIPIPQVAPPEQLTDFYEFCQQSVDAIKAGQLKVSKTIEENLERRLFDQKHSVIDIRPVDPEGHFMMKEFGNVPMHYWIKSNIPLGSDHKSHRSLVCYFSDLFLVGAAVYPHISQGNPSTMIASLDNTIWFHNYEWKADEWMLYEVFSPKADSGRALSFGKIWTQKGNLVATTAQEILARFEQRTKL